MIAFTSAAATDPGRVRDGNEDAFHLGDSVFAVADGMGGHLAGEVASTTALEPVAELDGRVFADAEAARQTLREALLEANTVVAEKARSEPRYRGMGTTLTAVLVEGRRVHVAHVGDSRAYLLRDQRFEQLTRDHTLVQHLIDEGQITPEEAASHPQRSIITRAIGVGLEVEVDTVSLEARAGDRILLCSDGLCGVVPDPTIARIVAGDRTPQQQAEQLVTLANDHGGPDNITALLLHFDGAEPAPGAPTDAGTDTSEDRGAQVITTGPGTSSGDWARKLGHLGAIGRPPSDGGDEDTPRGPGRARRAATIVAVLALLTVLAVAGGRWLLSRSYYVGVDDGRVAVFRGIPASFGPFDLHWREERSNVVVDELPEYVVDDLRDGRAAVSLADARHIVENYQRLASGDDRDDEGTPQPTPAPSTTPSTS